MATEIYTDRKWGLAEIEGDDFLDGWDDTRSKHMNDAEVIEKFRKEKAAHPDALVVMEDLDCGHWDVSVYTTEEEKQEFIRNKWSEFLGQFKSYLKRIKLPENLR